MFDDVARMTMRCAADFRAGVRDSFGASVVADVLEPIIKEIDSLRIFHEESQRQWRNIDQTLADVRSLQCKMMVDEVHE